MYCTSEVLATRRCPMLVISGATHALILAGDPRLRAGVMPHGRLLKSSSWVPHALGGPATRGPPSVYSGSVPAPSGQSRRTVTWKTATVPLGALCRGGTPNSGPHLGGRLVPLTVGLCHSTCCALITKPAPYKMFRHNVRSLKTGTFCPSHLFRPGLRRAWGYLRAGFTLKILLLFANSG